MNPADEARLEALAREYADLTARREPLENRMQEIRAEFRALLDYGSSRHAGLTVSVQHNPGRFDAKSFAASYPKEKFPHLYRDEPDKDAIKEWLPPLVVKSFTLPEGQPKVVIGR